MLLTRAANHKSRQSVEFSEQIPGPGTGAKFDRLSGPGTGAKFDRLSGPGTGARIDRLSVPVPVPEQNSINSSVPL
jgi:hypothetical protein